MSRLKQITDWLGDDFDGVIAFDESHKAKNLLPRSKGEPTKVGKAVEDLQVKLPQARVMYCSATGMLSNKDAGHNNVHNHAGISELRNVAYMVRLGLWGPGAPFTTFDRFYNDIGGRGVGALELIAMDMKVRRAVGL